MKKLTFILMVFSFGAFAQDDISGVKMVVDSVIVEDFKLNLAYDRIYSDGGLISTLERAASEEKLTAGNIVKSAAMKSFIEDINKAYVKYASKFIKVDTMYVDSLKVEQQIRNITTWQNEVLADSDIKNPQSLPMWIQKQKRLTKLLALRNQLRK